MNARLRTLKTFLALFVLVAIVAAAAQDSKFPGGTFRASDSDGNNIALTFDSAGTLVAYVNGDGFSRTTYEAAGDTLSFGELEAPEGYGCPGVTGKYLWKIGENRLTMTLIADNCAIRAQYFTGLAWIRG